MSDWVVVVKHRAEPARKRVFVENIAYPEEAEKMALLKLGVSSGNHDAHAELIDERVSIEDPNYNQKEEYEQLLRDIQELQGQWQEEHALAVSYLNRAEEAEKKSNRVMVAKDQVEIKIANILLQIENIHRDLRKIQ